MIQPSDLVGHHRWSRVHKRVWDTPGCIVDIGCAGWEWSRQFLGRKPVVGYDPLEKQSPSGAQLSYAAVGPAHGGMTLYGHGQEASCWKPNLAFVPDQVSLPMISLDEVVCRHSPIAVLKLNIERMEYAILPMVQHPVADQLAVSFHHHGESDSWRNAWTHGMIHVLSRWYEPVKLHGQWGWWLFLRRSP